MLICLPMMGAVILRDPTMPANYLPQPKTPISPQESAPSISPQAQPLAGATPAATDIAATPPAPIFVITAIFEFPKYRIAVINGQYLKVGDKIDEFTITTITPYTVELRGPDNTSQVLNLFTQVKAPAPKQ